MKNIKLSEKVVCDCGQKISVTAYEALNFDSVECPNCGSDTYHLDWMYEEALDVQDSLRK